MVSIALASILRSGRSDFNARFAAARRIYPDLQAEAFTEFLRTSVDDLVSTVESVQSDRSGEVIMVAYDCGLELVGQKLVGSAARFSEIEQGWRRILPRVARLVATAPGRLIPAVCNAIHQLASTSNARPALWIETMERLGPQCDDAEAFLKLGQVSAWRSGLAHFRRGAIAAADSLPEPLILSALGANSDSNWSSLRAKMLGDPWFDPALPREQSTGLRVVARIGSFRGFGGLFVEPPVVVSSGQDFLARSDNECWVLSADIFGATFNRVSIKEFEAAARQSSWPSNLTVTNGRIALNDKGIQLPDLGEFASAAGNSTTLALTSPFTHSIVLVALN